MTAFFPADISGRAFIKWVIFGKILKKFLLVYPLFCMISHFPGKNLSLLYFFYGGPTMLSKKLVTAFNEQIAFEIHSALIYKAMQAYFAAEDFPGMANWMGVQYQEELAHAEKMFNFVCDAGGRAEMLALEQPRNEFSSPLEAFETTLAHEQIVTERISKLMELAQKEKSHAAQICLQWFITEQVEEEANASLIIKKLKMVEGDGRGLLMIDQELAQRVFVPIATA